MPIIRRFTADQRRTFFYLIGAGLLLSLLFLIVITRLHEDISHPRVEHLDQSILQLIHQHDNPGLTHLAKTLSFIGSPMTLFPLVALSAFILHRFHLNRDALLVVISMTGAATIDTLLKLHYRRIRPDVPWAFVHERSFSFPSGHSVMAVVTYGIITWLLMQYLHRTWQHIALIAVSLTLIAGIGASRLYLAVHYPSDVVGGYFVGAIWLFAVILADWSLRRLDPRAVA
jgi:undecaprenyl-diphosphatase